jgi:DNA-binding IclR family transcriptional regulator
VSAQAQRRNQSVHKAAALLRAVVEAREPTTVSELARRAGLPRATALRMVEALLTESFLWRMPDDRVVLGAGLLAVARAGNPDALLLEASEGPLLRLAEIVRETITLTVLHQDGSLEIVRQLDGPHMLGLTNWVGRPFPIHASSSGKLALALGSPALRARLPAKLERHASRTITDPRRLDSEIAVIREQRYSEMVDELEDGLAALSAPILLEGELLATVNADGPTARFDARARARALTPLREAAAAAERLLTSDAFD